MGTYPCTAGTAELPALDSRLSMQVRAMLTTVACWASVCTLSGWLVGWTSFDLPLGLGVLAIFLVWSISLVRKPGLSCRHDCDLL